MVSKARKLIWLSQRERGRLARSGYRVVAGVEISPLIMHAALCDHCGPRLRAAALHADATPQEEKLLAELKTPSRPGVLLPAPAQVPARQFPRWLVPAFVLLVIVGMLSTLRSTSAAPLSGQDLAEFAVKTHKYHAKGNLPLDVRTDSSQVLNQWFKQALPFSLSLPAASSPQDQRYRLVGARLVQVGSNSAALIIYQRKSELASLMVTPDSVAVASGGVEKRSARSVFITRWSKATKLLRGHSTDSLTRWCRKRGRVRNNLAWFVTPLWATAILLKRRLLCVLKETPSPSCNKPPRIVKPQQGIAWPLLPGTTSAVLLVSYA